MSKTPTSTVIITGGSGSLGSTLAIIFEQTHPRKYHLVLTTRSLTDARTIQITAALKALSASFEIQSLDLSSLENVKRFASIIEGKIERNEIPPMAGGGLVNSAAITNYQISSSTKDGWKEMYGVNVLANMLLVFKLLPQLEGGIVVNVSSMTHGLGGVDTDYFGDNRRADSQPDIENQQGKIGLMEANRRYGAVKLLTIMACYALQRRISLVSVSPKDKTEYN